MPRRRNLPAGLAVFLAIVPAADASEDARVRDSGPVSIADAAAVVADLAAMSDALAGGYGRGGGPAQGARGLPAFGGPGAALDRYRGWQGPVIEAAPEPLFGRALWDPLPPPAPRALAWLATRVEGLSGPSVRELSWSAAEPVVAAAAARRLSALELFTDDGLRGPEAYFLGADALAELGRRYDIRTISMISGLTLDGDSFRMEGLVLGGGRVILLYDHDRFDYVNPDYPNYSYTARSRITETIRGSGDLSVEGLSLRMIFHPRIQRFVKISDGEVRVETNHGSAVVDLHPIVPRIP